MRWTPQDWPIACAMIPFASVQDAGPAAWARDLGQVAAAGSMRSIRPTAG
ncbi:hypothetical protein FLP41_18545 [Paracoccus marcusii]|nr:hypothetical protein FLP41_18545 [Paracoccus marcusii]